MKSSSHKIILSCLLALFLASCTAAPDGSQGTQSNSRRTTVSSKSGDISIGSDGLASLDLGEDWDQPLRPVGQSFRDPSDSSGLAEPGQIPAGMESLNPAEWAIVLFTYTNPDHVNTAEYAANQLRALGGNFLAVRARTRKNGSMVLYGSYSGRDDPAAREALLSLRAMERNGKRVFPRVILSYIEADVDILTLSPNDLRTVRLEYPHSRGLTTLDVGVWSTFGNEKIDYGRLKRDAEQYAAQLRSQGFQAYYYHDEKTKTSSVTVGLFGPGAIDAQSGMYSAEVLEYLKQFPYRRNNGQPLNVPIDRRHPDRGTRIQAPVLVEVP